MGKNKNNLGFGNSILKNTVMKPSYWIYLAIFCLASSLVFFAATILGGSSNIAAAANYSILALLVIAPILMTGNNIRLGKNDNEVDAVMGKWLCHICVFVIGLLIYIVFAAIIAARGTFRAPLFLNSVLNVALFGAAVISFAMLLTTTFDRRRIGYICLYAIAALLIAIELLLGRLKDTGSALYRAMYAISVSKLTQCMRLGILDRKTMILYVLVIVFSLFVTVLIVKRRNGEWRSGAVKYIVPAVLLLGILALVFTPNGAVSGADMTPAKYFSLGSAAREYAESVEDDATITVADTKSGFISKNDYSAHFVQAERIINQIAGANGKINLEYDAKAADADDVSTGDVIVSRGEKTKTVKSSDLFTFNYTYDEEGNAYPRIASSRVEEAVCSALNDVLEETGSQVAFLLNGSENENYKNLAGLMEDSGFEITYVDINSEEIPDVKLAVIFAPTQDYSSTVALENYMYNKGEYGHNLLYVANSDTNVILPSLSSFLNLWGVTVENYNVVETDPEAYTNGNAFYGMNEYIEYSFISDYTYLEDPAVVPYARDIVTDEENEDMTYRTLLRSKDTSCLTNQNTPRDEYNNYNTAVIASYYQENLFGTAYTGVEAHVGVVGSEKAFDTDVLDSDEYSNAKYFADVIRELAEENQASVSISPKTLALGGVSTSSAEKAVIGIVLLAVPAAFIALAVITYVKGRKKAR